MKTNSEFKYDDSGNQCRKNIKLENQKITLPHITLVL